MNVVALDDLLVVTDFDGTLAPIVEVPDQVRPAKGAADALEALANKVRSLILLTGRSRESLDQVFPPDQTPHVRRLCNYGVDDLWRNIDLRPLDRFREQLAYAVLPRGVHVEEKAYSLAVHTRGSDNPIRNLHATYVALAPIAANLGLTIHRGRDVLDFSVSTMTKASALKRLIAEVEPLGVVIFGDDHSDIAAFQSLTLPRLAVGVTSHEVEEMEYIADVVLNSPAEVVGFMEELATFTHVELTVPQSE